MNITINGRIVTVPEGPLDYQQIVNLAATPWGTKALHCITYRHKVPFEQLPGEREGMICPGQSVKISPGMVVNAVVTGSA